LIQLIPEAKQAFYEDKLTVAHTFEIARLQPNDQRRALQECFPQHRNTAAVLKDKKAEATTVRELRGWIEREIHLDLTNAPFDPQDETLLPKAGACARCPKRTGTNPLLFPEVRQKSTCTLCGIGPVLQPGRIVVFSLRRRLNTTGGTDGPGIYDLRSPLGKISESL